MTCRDEILALIPSVAAPDGTFTPEQVAAMRAQGCRYAESTVRTHVTSRMCADTPNHHARTYDDLIRVDRGRYCLRRTEQ